MTFLEMKNFYKEDFEKYEINKNKEFLEWLNDKIANGYIPLVSNDILQNMIDDIAKWYEIKYPESEFDYYEGINNLKLQKVKRLSKEMSFEQLLHRLSYAQFDLIKCDYRTGFGYCTPIYEEDKIVSYKSFISMQIKINPQKDFDISKHYIDYKLNYHFNIDASPSSGKVVIDYNLKNYVSSKDINLEQLLFVLKNKYQDRLDFKELEICIDTHNIDLELRNKIFQLISLKLLYSKNTLPERGYERAKRFINEFNKKLNLNLTTFEIDKIINRDYSKLEYVEENNNSVGSVKKLIKKIFTNKKVQQN